jgi:hypothetical protein
MAGCIPTKWLSRTTRAPKLVWEDSGTGGRPGAIWATNGMHLVTVTKGHAPPVAMFYEMRNARFFLRCSAVFDHVGRAYV